MTVTSLDSDVLELLDFEFTPPCEAPEGCDGAAEWRVRVGCCGHLYLLCQECVDEILEWQQRAAKASGLNVQCARCNNIVPIRAFTHSMERI